MQKLRKELSNGSRYIQNTMEKASVLRFSKTACGAWNHVLISLQYLDLPAISQIQNPCIVNVALQDKIIGTS